MKVYQSETNEWLEMDILGKLKYVGPYMGELELSPNKEYPVVRIELGMFGIVDDTDEDYLYSATKPGPCDDPTITGKWEVIEDPTGILEQTIESQRCEE